MEGGQSLKVLSERERLVGVSLQYSTERALDEVTKGFINGGKSLGVKGHRVPVYKNRKSFLKRKDMSKVLEVKKSKTGLSFLRLLSYNQTFVSM